MTTSFLQQGGAQYAQLLVQFSTVQVQEVVGGGRVYLYQKQKLKKVENKNSTLDYTSTTRSNTHCCGCATVGVRVCVSTVLLSGRRRSLVA